MKKEYDAIHAKGYVLQLDCPDLAAEHTKQFWGLSDAEYLGIVDMHVAAINEAIADILPDRVRLQLCWENYCGLHTHDFPFEPLLPRLYRANVGALSIEFSNPRHQHEYAAFRRHPLPGRLALIPRGDRERVIAGTDCGFGTIAGFDVIVPSIAWTKLAALRAGARLASQRLW